jgi:hypothetical protein
MLLNAKPSEVVGIVAKIDPDATAASTVTSGWVAAKNYQAFMAIVIAGALGSSATLDGKLEQAQDGSGTGAKDITGKAITQLTQAGTDSSKQAVINLRPEELDVDNAFTHFRLSMTVATATSDVGGLVLGLFPARGPATGVDATTVDEVVG